jgi:WD40 repeat protein/predicted Ser/Thr protein kinase
MSDGSPTTLPQGDGKDQTRAGAGSALDELSRLQDELRRRWTLGERVLIEKYRSGTSAKLFEDPDQLLDLLYHEVLLREEFGDAPEVEEYVGRFPQFAEQVRDLFEVHRAFTDPQGPGGWTTSAAGSAGARTLPAGPDGELLLPAGRFIPGYELIRELGRGGMGVVYLARQAGLDRLVAVKMILAGEFSRPRDRARLQAEAAAVARLDHPNLVRIYEVGEWDGRPFFSMEYVEGPRLAEILRGTPMSPQRAAELGRALARASQSAHERGVVHRDLTPNNVLIAADGQPKIVDFGLSKLITGGAGATLTGDVLGTASYMAPEQAGGRSKEVGPAADVYALGAILYEMLSGRPPFRAETPLDTLVQVVHDDPVAPGRLQPKVPRDLENICLKCLNKEPARRYPSALALAEDLNRYLAGLPVSARPVGMVSRAARWARRRPGTAALLAVSAAGAFLAFGLVTWESRRASRAQASAERASQEEKRERIAAEAARGREAVQRRLYQELSARLLRDRGLRQCEDGDVGLGLLWMAQSLRLVAEDDLDLQRAIRTNLAGWRGQTHTLQGLLGHADRILSAVWSPDGKLILTAGADRTAQVWDPATGALRRPPLVHSRPVSLAAFSPDGATILTIAGREARLWATATGEPTERPLDLGAGAELIAHQFSPDGDRLWTVVRRGQSAWLRAWQTSRGKAMAPPFELGRGVALATFSPDAQVLVTAGADDSVPPRLWKIDPPAPIRALAEHTRRVSAVVFNPKTGHTFATGSLDRTCYVWNSTTGEPVRGPMRLPGQIRTVAFSPNGRMILAGASDGTAQFWDVEQATPLHALMRHPDAVSAAQFSADGRWASTLSWDRVYLWDSATGEALGAPISHPKEVAGAAFEPAGRFILTRGRDFKVRIWETAPARPGGARLAHNGWVTAVAFRPPRGDSFLTAVGGSDGRVRSWQTALTGEPRDILENIGPILSLAYATDGRRFAAGTVRREVRLWNTEAARPTLNTPLALADRVWAVAFSPDGQTLLTGIERRRAEFWDLATGQPRLPPIEHERAVYAVAYSPDGRTVLTGSEDMTAKLWDAVTHRPLGVSMQHHGTVYAVAFRPPDGRMILTGSGDRTARLWDAATGHPLGEPFQHPARVLAVAFSPDGRTIATGCGDGLARLWDVGTGHPLGRPIKHRGSVRAVAFGPSPPEPGADEPGRWLLLTGGEDMTARLHEVPEPLEESPEAILRALQVANGMTLDAHGMVESLEPEVWKRLRRESARRGGPGSASVGPGRSSSSVNDLRGRSGLKSH